MKKKKFYNAPIISIYSLDQEICLLMSSPPDDGGPPDPFKSQIKRQESIIFPNQKYPFPDWPEYE